MFEKSEECLVVAFFFKETIARIQLNWIRLSRFPMHFGILKMERIQNFAIPLGWQ